MSGSVKLYIARTRCSQCGKDKAGELDMDDAKVFICQGCGHSWVAVKTVALKSGFKWVPRDPPQPERPEPPALPGEE